MQNYNSFEFQPVMTTRSSSNKVLGRNFNAKGSFTSNGDSSEFKTSSKESNMRLRKPRDMINPWGKVVKVNMFWSTIYFLFETKNAKPCKLSTQSDFDKMLQNVNPSDLKSKVLIQVTRSFGFVQPTLQIPLHMISLLWRNFVTHQTQTAWIFFFRQNYRMLSFPSPSGSIWSSLGSRSLQSLPSFAFSFSRFKVPVIFAIWAPSNGKHVKITALEMGKSRPRQFFSNSNDKKTLNESNESKLDPSFQNGSLLNLILRFVLIGRRCILCQKHIERDPAHVQKVWLLRPRSSSQWLGGFHLKICKKQVWFANY